MYLNLTPRTPFENKTNGTENSSFKSKFEKDNKKDGKHNR